MIATEVYTTENHKHLICWKSVAAGLAVTFFTLVGLLGLGMAFGSIALDSETTASGASIFTSVWFTASSFIALFIGSYFTARVSRSTNTKMGGAQGLVLASIFVAFVLWQTLMAIGLVGKVAGGAAMVAGAGAASTMASPTMNRLVEDSMADLNLKSEPRVVATGVAQRLINGNVEGAKVYLAREANMSPAEADARIATLKAKFDSAVDEAKQAAATALRATGWTLAIMVVLSAIASAIGGMLGSKFNFTNPIIRTSNSTISGRPHTI